MTKLTLTTVGSTLTNTAATQINANNAAIVAAVENTLSRDGSVPNQMNADIDMNGNDLLNVSRANVESLFIDGEGVQSVNLATALKISNNLSDVQSVTAARSNLGLGTAAVLNALVGTATYDPPSLVDGAGASTTVTVTGAVLGDVALASFSLSTQGITVTANVTAADTVTVRFQNETTGTIDLASGTLKAVVFK